jgi:hypothetical protein
MELDREKVAQGLRLLADAFCPIEKTLKHNPKPVLEENWKTEPLEAKNGDDTNVYQILLNHVGSVNKPFDVHEMTKHRDKNPFKHCSLARLMLELKALEVEKLAVAIDDNRQKWILLKA